MSATASPRGLVPVGLLGGTPFAGSTRSYPIKSGYNTTIYNGDIVGIGTGGNAGHMIKEAHPGEINPVGVFLGCSYTDPSTGQHTHSNRYPANTVASDILAVVSCDPNTVYEIQADGAVTQANLGQTIDVTGASGNDVNGNSTMAADQSTIADAALLLRIVDFVSRPESTVGDAKTDLIVMFNPAQHIYAAEDALDDANN